MLLFLIFTFTALSVDGITQIGKYINKGIYASFQPEIGPGGKNYKYTSVKSTVYGKGENAYIIFEPDLTNTTANNNKIKLPVIILIHGWWATDSAGYRLWIEHIVKNGNFLIYPIFQNEITLSEIAMQNAVIAIKNALNNLNDNKYFKPDSDKFALLGHSAGGIMAANIASIAKEEQMPLPKAVMSVDPARTENKRNRERIELYDLTGIDKNTYFLIVIGDNDQRLYDKADIKIYNAISQIPCDKKNYVVINSDNYGIPPLIANHWAPLAMPDSITSNLIQNKSINQFVNNRLHFVGANNLDYYGFWKLFDALTNAAFYNKNLDYLNGTEKEKFMGYWSDGTPVKKLTVKDCN